MNHSTMKKTIVAASVVASQIVTSGYAHAGVTRSIG